MPQELQVTQPMNPTDEERHAMLRKALQESGRPEDFVNVVELLSPPPDIKNYASPGEFKEKKVGIMGGGAAGLAAAYELRKLGFDITIFEALENRVGGRIYTYYFDKEKKLYGELGAMRIPVSHEATWHYINLFKLNTKPFVQSNPNSFVYVKGVRVRNSSENITKYIYPLFNLTPRERNISWDNLYDYAFNFTVKALPPSIRREILQILPVYSPQYQYMIDSNIRNVLEDLGFSEPAIDMLTSVDPFGAFLYNSFSEQIMETYPAAFGYLYRIDGGNSMLPLAFYNSLMSSAPTEVTDIAPDYLGKITWKGGYHVTDIYYLNQEQRVSLGYANTNEDIKEMDTFDYVVCAIPFSTLREVNIYPLFSNRKMQAIREVNYSASQKTLFLCSRRFWEEDTAYGRINGGVSTTDMPIQAIVYPSDHTECKNLVYAPEEAGVVSHVRETSKSDCSPESPGVITASYNFNLDAVRLGNMSDRIRFKLIKRQVEMVHGLPEGYLDPIVTNHITLNWNVAPWTRGAFAIFNSEQKRIFSYEMLKPEFNGRIYFAGEHLSTTHAWMQGALYTGKLAANHLARNARMQNKSRP